MNEYILMLLCVVKSKPEVDNSFIFIGMLKNMSLIVVHFAPALFRFQKCILNLLFNVLYNYSHLID